MFFFFTHANVQGIKTLCFTCCSWLDTYFVTTETQIITKLVSKYAQGINEQLLFLKMSGAVI